VERNYHFRYGLNIDILEEILIAFTDERATHPTSTAEAMQQVCSEARQYCVYLLTLFVDYRELRKRWRSKGKAIGTLIFYFIPKYPILARYLVCSPRIYVLNK